MGRDRPELSIDLEPHTLQPVLRDGVVIAVLLVVLGLASVLPGAGRALPGLGVSVGALGTALVAAGIVAAVLHAVPAVGDLVRSQLRGDDEVVEDLATAARHLAVFVAVLVAHAGFSSVVVPLLPAGTTWMYDVAFLGFALFAVVGFAYRLYRNADVVGGWLAEELAGSSGAPSREDTTRTS